MGGNKIDAEERQGEAVSYTYFPAANYMNQQFVRAVCECEADCGHTAAYIIREADVKARLKQASLLADCADICSLAAKYAARGSAFARQAASICADVCENCANECAKFADGVSQDCARICLRCANECDKFTGAI